MILAPTFNFSSSTKAVFAIVPSLSSTLPLNLEVYLANIISTPQGNIIDSLGGVRGDEDFADVTLSCCGSGDGGGSGAPVRAHKLILASCSNYFRRILRNLDGGLDSAHAHPTIILGDVDHSTLEALVTYMYRGEVFVSEDRLPAFFTAAQGFDSMEN